MRSIRSYFLQYLLVCMLLFTAAFLTYRLVVEYPREVATIELHQLRELTSLQEGLRLNQHHLSNVVRDWAHWDDTYEYILNPDGGDAYIRANLISGTFDTFELVAILLFDHEFQLVYGQGYDQRREMLVPLTSVLAELPQDLLFQGYEAGEALDRVGWLATQQGAAGFALDYITDSMDEAEPAGYLMFIQLITDEQIRGLEAVTRLQIKMQPALTTIRLSDIEPLHSDRLVEGYQKQRLRVLQDVSGRPLLLMEITHDPLFDPVMLRTGDVLMLLGIVLTPLLLFFIADRLLLKPLKLHVEHIETMVSKETMEEFPVAMPIWELEQFRLAFNRSVHLVDMQYKRLLYLSQTDSLTGIPNRRAFDEYAESAWRRARRVEKPFMLAIIDLDYFKAYNDSLGHNQGDQALRKLGELLHGFTRRASEFSARLGGEEFVIVINGLSAEVATERMEALRQAIEGLQLEHPDSKVSPVVTASIGLVCVEKPSQAYRTVKLSFLLEMADQELYKAKAQGRNRICARHLSLSADYSLLK
ncbi:diguanylate cyclase [Nitrincola alkalilacustris]|uniref:sensor domain-containing diguanylate cyclase n=1 Tax=Nitrincola alkalilacustris TaxID=1571224 RepID=UPI00124F607C|nr:diguanylate cyclase [Nitrincola alkalilacustris]